MDRDIIIDRIGELIDDYKGKKEILSEMILQWNKYGGSGNSHPDLQYEVECRIDSIWEELVNLCKKIDEE